MKSQVLKDGPLKGQRLEASTHVFTLKGQTGAYRRLFGELVWVAGK